MRYSDDTINKMVRKALYLERVKKFDEALNIYMELASYGNEYSRDRIPLIKHKIEQSRLKNVNFFLKSITLGISALTALVILTSTLDSMLIKPISIIKDTQPVNENYFNENNLTFTFNETDNINTEGINPELEILVEQNISSENLKNRVIEALNLYKGELIPNRSEFKILVKTFYNGDIVGTIEYNKNKPTVCIINLIKK